MHFFLFLVHKRVWISLLQMPDTILSLFPITYYKLSCTNLIFHIIMLIKFWFRWDCINLARVNIIVSHYILFALSVLDVLLPARPCSIFGADMTKIVVFLIIKLLEHKEFLEKALATYFYICMVIWFDQKYS